jgi:hypothetical protein
MPSCCSMSTVYSIPQRATNWVCLFHIRHVIPGAHEKNPDRRTSIYIRLLINERRYACKHSTASDVHLFSRSASRMTTSGQNSLRLSGEKFLRLLAHTGSNDSSFGRPVGP